MKPWESGYFLMVEPVAVSEALRLCREEIERLRTPGPRVGWWVAFDEPDDMGETSEGFFIDDKRARTFGKEPGWLRHHLEPIYRTAPCKPGGEPNA